jgi:hypothetical protein
VLNPALGAAGGGSRYYHAWPDAAAEWIVVRVLAPREVEELERVPLSRAIVFGATRAVFVVVVLAEVWRLWRRARTEESMLRPWAAAANRVLLLGILLAMTQGAPWYYAWVLPFAALLGWRDWWARASIVTATAFSLTYYWREFDQFGIFYLPLYLAAAGAGIVLFWLIEWTRVRRAEGVGVG